MATFFRSGFKKVRGKQSVLSLCFRSRFFQDATRGTCVPRRSSQTFVDRDLQKDSLSPFSGVFREIWKNYQDPNNQLWPSTQSSFLWRGLRGQVSLFVVIQLCVCSHNWVMVHSDVGYSWHSHCRDHRSQSTPSAYYSWQPCHLWSRDSINSVSTVSVSQWRSGAITT